MLTTQMHHELPKHYDEKTGTAYAPLFHHALTHGVALAPSAYEVGFLSLAHTRADIDDACHCARGRLRGRGRQHCSGEQRAR